MEFAPLKPGVQPAMDDPRPRSETENGRKYELKVVQQPKRARMCGFGDKDRRPITPPPCVRLIITDVLTGKEVDCNEIDHGMFVLNVDLWHANGLQEVNLVKHSPGTSGHPGSNISPISYTDAAAIPAYAPNTATSPSYREPPREHVSQGSTYTTTQPASQYGSGQNLYSPYQQHQGPLSVSAYSQSPQAHQQSTAPSPYSQGSYQQSPSYASTNHSPYPPPHNGYQHPQSQAPSYITSGIGIHALSSTVGPPGMAYNSTRTYDPSRYSQLTSPAPTGMFTRNLIGSLSASAFRLTDQNDFIGIWFVLQDLSVRTEGEFRLRFSFVNVGSTTAALSTPHQPSQQNLPPGTVTQGINTGRALVLASCFSEPFAVFSAKKFPGVVESTDLSKCFATQGIKIPIRRDQHGPVKGVDKDEYNED